MNQMYINYLLMRNNLYKKGDPQDKNDKYINS